MVNSSCHQDFVASLVNSGIRGCCLESLGFQAFSESILNIVLTIGYSLTSE